MSGRLGSHTFLILAAIAAGATFILLAGQISTAGLIHLFSAPSSIATENDLRLAEASRFPMDVRDNFKISDKAGDSDQNHLKLDQDFVDPDASCEFCLRVEFTPGQTGQVAYSYSSGSPVDLSSAKRLTFFAKGETGTEKVKFVAAGTDSTSASDGKSKELFKDTKFGAKTSDVSLDKAWKKYEISLKNADLKKISKAFGFEVNMNPTDKPIVFYLKGITLDLQDATNPLPQASSQ